jgi:SAM-dependent methyltransferase
MSKIKVLLADSLVKFADKINHAADNYRYRPFVCSVCERPVQLYIPYNGWEMLIKHKTRLSIFSLETFNFPSYWCPNCKANDRDRLYALFLKELFSKIDSSKKYTFIDFAPETESLGFLIKSQPFLNYRSADLFMPNVDDTVDLQDMKIYGDNTVDFFVCSHMLEHVPDDRKAIRELYRILKPGGLGIAMVPIDLSLSEIFEDPTITDEDARWTHFGQNDHLRVYSKSGFIARLQEGGFKVEQKGVEYFGEQKFKKAGIYPRSILYVVSK